MRAAAGLLTFKAKRWLSSAAVAFSAHHINHARQRALLAVGWLALRQTITWLRCVATGALFAHHVDHAVQAASSAMGWSMIRPSMAGSYRAAKYAVWVQTHHAIKAALFTVSRTLLSRQGKGGTNCLALGALASGETSHSLISAWIAMAGFLAKKAPSSSSDATFAALLGPQVNHPV